MMIYNKPMTKICSVNDCGKKYAAKGLCVNHYYRLKRRGRLDTITERHNMRNTPEYNCWDNMRRRCNDPSNKSYKNYGGRGIKVCDAWQNSFIAFYTDMGKRPKGKTLDRVDNNGNYEPDNCKWRTYSEQMLNRRMLKNNTSGHRNIYWRSDISKWRVVVFTNNKRVTIGNYLTLKSAVAAQSNYLTATEI